MIIVKTLVALIAVVALQSPAIAQDVHDGVKNAPGIEPAVEPFPAGKAVYTSNCAVCHETASGRAPHRSILAHYSPEAIRKALISGSMQSQGAALSEEQKTEVAQFLTRTKIGARVETPEPEMCEPDRAGFDMDRPPAFTGWGFDPQSTHSVSSDRAGIGPDELSRLKVKWAFGFPNANRARSQPALGGGALFVGSHDGQVYALDRETGCVRWIYEGSAEVRTGIVVSPWEAGAKDAASLTFFGDFAGNVYALDTFSGSQVWKKRAESHTAAVITGTPTLHDGLLYVPVSSLEEGAAASPTYECCTFRGSVVAFDADTGAEQWRTYLVDEPKPREAPSEDKNDHFGPSGVAVWTSPTIDQKRGQLYVTTGDNYSQPATELSDAIVALDLKTGKINWHFQATEGDAWNVACVLPDAPNCPEDAGPDFDFGATPILARGSDRREYVLAGQKSGIAYAVDPDTGGLRWQHRLGRGGLSGGIHFGIAASKGRLFVPVSDLPDGQPSEFPLSPGMYAVDIATGTRLWSAPAPDVCNDRPLCVTGYGASVTATPDLLIAGADDGYVRIYDTVGGKVLWEFDTARAFETVNGVAAHGGAISGSAGPIVEGGQMIVSSGYGFVSKMPGNLLLVLEAD